MAGAAEGAVAYIQEALMPLKPTDPGRKKTQDQGQESKVSRVPWWLLEAWRLPS